MTDIKVIMVSKYQDLYHVWDNWKNNDFRDPDFRDSKYDKFGYRGDALIYAHNRCKGTDWIVQEEDLDARKEKLYIKFCVPNVYTTIDFIMFGDILVIDPATLELIRIERDGRVIYQKEIKYE